MKNKLALVLSGGGMTCSYTAGFLSALAGKLGITDPDIIIAGSGSAGTASYFVAKQWDSVTNIWSNRLSTREFLDKARLTKVIDIDYLIDEVFKIDEPLDVAQIKNSKTQLLIPATRTDNCEVDYFSNRDDVDIFEVLRATKAMPILYNKHVTVGNAEYCDTHLSADIDLNIQKAVTMGATHIVAISTDGPAILATLGYDIWVNSRPKEFRENYKKYRESEVKYQVPRDVKLFLATPREKLPVGALDNSKEKLDKAIAIGFNDCASNTELAQFLSE